MGHRRRLLRSLLARTAALLGAVAVLLALAPTAFAQRVLNETFTSDGSSQPIQLSAEQISTWTEAGQQIFLLQGGMVVNQATTTIRGSDGVVWVDMSRYQSERVLLVTVYGENPIGLERNNAAVNADYGFVRLATSNKMDIKAFKSKIAQEDKSGDAVYRRALASRPADVALPIRKVDAAVQPLWAAPVANEGIRLVGGTQPAPLPAPPVLGPKDPPIPNLPTTVFQIPSEPSNPAAPILPQGVPGPPGVPAAPAPAPVKSPPQISIRPRYDGDLQVQYKPLADNMTAVIVSGGVTLIVTVPSDTPGGKPSVLDMEADRAVIWTKGGGPPLLGGVKSPQNVENGAHEIYLAGHVELRTRTKGEVETLRADEVYYDVRRGVAVSRKADLELKSAKLPRPLHLVTDELLQVNPKLYKARTTSIFASILPSDPGLVLEIDDLTIEEYQKDKTILWGIPRYDKDGKRVTETERIFTGRNMVARLEGLPIFYFPYLKDRVEDPLGPLDNLNFSYNSIFGFQIYTTWDIFDLLNLSRPDGTRWRLMLDYLTLRGPGFGSEFDFEGNNLFGIKSRYSGNIRLYGLFDSTADTLGGNRGKIIYWPDVYTQNPITHPNFRGWAYGKFSVQDLPDGFSALGQVSILSDHNFLEQFYLMPHLNEMNQDTYLYVKQQQNNWAWTIQGQISTRDWITETDWLPKADGYLIGQTFLDDRLVYNTHASAGYGRLRPTGQVPFAYLPTDVRVDTARLDWMNELSLPFYLGPVKVAPYGVIDGSYYSQDVAGDSRGRFYGGGGVRWNMPLSRAFPDIQSELLNLNGIYHKMNFVGNYFNGYASSGVNNFPQLDRLNDDASDQALRDIRPLQLVYNPTASALLTNSPIFNPQQYAIRRLVTTSPDTLDTMDVVQLGINQRLQTKRGSPGNEHVTDWMSLNLGVSIFPHSTRDNFGHHFGILEYDWTWNLGDRTAFVSSGFFEPWQGGPRAFEFGTIVGRPDTTTLYAGYRQIDPINSKAVIVAAIYPFSAKYSLSASTVWDFGANVRSYSIFVARMGTDVLVNFGFNYNSTLNTFNLAFEMIPNVTRPIGRSAGLFPIPVTNIDPMVNIR